MGIEIKLNNSEIIISGKGLLGLKKPGKDLFLGNSGTTMRMLPGILAGQDFEVTLTGDESLSKRPMDRIIEPLKRMGVDVSSKGKNGLPPLVVKGKEVKPIDFSSKVASAQVKSCIIFAGLYAKGTTSVTEPFASRDHTERMLEFYGARISRSNLTVSVEGKSTLEGKNFFIPGDISSAAFIIGAGALLEGSDIVMRDVGLNPTRMGFVEALKKMGSNITVLNKKNAVEPYGDISVKFAPLKSIVIEKKDVPLLIDEVPILAVLASQAEGTTTIKGISELRVKETDRIFSITDNLSRMGVDIKTVDDNLVIFGKRKRFAKTELNSFGDHRTAMGVSVASLSADGECTVKDVDCVNTSFPGFFDIIDCLKK